MHVLKMILAPVAVAAFMLTGAITFQILLYWRYGQSLFDNMDLPGADFVWFAHSPAIVRWPAQLIARALHLWAVQPFDAVVVLALGTVVAWIWMFVRMIRAQHMIPSA